VGGDPSPRADRGLGLKLGADVGLADGWPTSSMQAARRSESESTTKIGFGFTIAMVARRPLDGKGLYSSVVGQFEEGRAFARPSSAVPRLVGRGAAVWGNLDRPIRPFSYVGLHGDDLLPLFGFGHFVMTSPFGYSAGSCRPQLWLDPSENSDYNRSAFPLWGQPRRRKNPHLARWGLLFCREYATLTVIVASHTSQFRLAAARTAAFHYSITADRITCQGIVQVS